VSGILDRRLLFVMGKGGTGKSTVAAALGLAAARRGRRVLLCEVAGQQRVTRTLVGRPPSDRYEETELAPGLWATSVDPESALEEYLRSQLPSRTLFELLKRSRIFQYLVAAAPGSRELLTIGKIWETAQLDRPWTGAELRYDLVIVDSPATGHGLAMLAAPRTFRDVAGVGRIQRQAGRIDSFVRDPESTGVVAVALPEEMPVSETIELGAALEREIGLELGLVVMNGVYPQRFARDEERLGAARAAAPAGPVLEAIDAALSQNARAQAQLQQIARIAEPGREMVPLPHVFAPELTRKDVEDMSDLLEERL
jgi:anion-transporting  ArsA/GET3 family ATPase